jgi:hypothetical protein
VEPTPSASKKSKSCPVGNAREGSAFYHR